MLIYFVRVEIHLQIIVQITQKLTWLKITELAIKSVRNVERSSVIGTFNINLTLELLILKKRMNFRVIDVGSEWRSFSSNDKPNEDRSRVGDSEDSPKSATGLSTIIVPNPKGAASMAVNGDNGLPKHIFTRTVLLSYSQSIYMFI